MITVASMLPPTFTEVGEAAQSGLVMAGVIAFLADASETRLCNPFLKSAPSRRSAYSSA